MGANGNGQLADLWLRRTEWHRGQVNAISSHNSKISVRIISDQGGMSPLAVGQCNHDFGGSMNHMAIGEYESIGSKEEPRARAASFARAIPSALSKLTYLNVSHRRPGCLRCFDYRIGVCIEQLSIVINRGAGRHCRSAASVHRKRV